VAAENMVMTPKIGGTIDYPNRGRLFDHTYQPRIPAGIPADAAGLLLREVAALRARADPLGY
jgi:hypothetical protein